VSSLIEASNFDWPIIDGPCGPDGPEGVTYDQWVAAREAAVRWLWALSGRQFGTWTVTFRPEWTQPFPVSRLPWGYRDGLGLTPWLSGQGMLPGGSCGAARPAGVQGKRITLPGPVLEVIEVTVDGSALPPESYALQGDDLVRMDGEDWPASQDVTAVEGDLGTWQVTYRRGQDVPQAGRVAAGVLVCELAKAMVGNDCELPINTTQVTRGGVTVSLDELTQGFTGLALVDQWARSVNPNGLRQPPIVWSPDLDSSLLPKPVITS
jgi:hypothetical protein